MSKCNHTFHRLGGIDDCPVCNPQPPAKPPREFWIVGPDDDTSSVFNINPGFNDQVHVIERSYADRLEQELADVRKERDQALAQAAALAGALEKCQQPDGQAGFDDAELFEQYFTHVEPQPMGTPKTIFRLGHAQGMANLARLTRKALAEYRAWRKERGR